MKMHNLCKYAGREMVTAIWKYARRLGAAEITIHKDGSITLMCADGCICERYKPSAKELKIHG